MEMQSRLAAGALLCSFLGAPALAGPSGTTLQGTKTASATITRTESFGWTIQKTSSSSAPYIIPQGQSSPVGFTVTATRTGLAVSFGSGPVSGVICLTNTGTSPTIGLYLHDGLEEFTNGEWHPLGVPILVAVSSELPAGAAQCYPYQIAGVVLDPAKTYRNHALASIDNYLGHEGTSFGIDIFANVAITQILNQIDSSALVTDTFACPAGFTCAPTGFSQTVGGGAVIPFTVQMSNTSVACGSTLVVNNSVILDPSTSHATQSAFATATVSTGTCPIACPVTTVDPRCSPPLTFTFQSAQNGNWTTGSTWVGGVAPAVESINNQRIKITHTVTVQNNNLRLDNSTQVFVTGGGALILRNGNIRLEDGVQSSTEKLLLDNATLRTSGNVQQTGSATVVCVRNSKVEVGDEDATSTPSVFTAGIFASSGGSTSAIFQNTQGYRRLENTCLNVTSGMQNDGGVDEILGVCAEIGDRGAFSGPKNGAGGVGSRDAEDSGTFEVKNSPGTLTTICNSEFYVPNGKVLNGRTAQIYNTQFRLTDESATFENQSSAVMTGDRIVVWINSSGSGNIINQSTWSAATVSAWRTDNTNTPTGLPGLVAESSAASIGAFFGDCACGSLRTSSSAASGGRSETDHIGAESCWLDQGK